MTELLRDVAIFVLGSALFAQDSSPYPNDSAGKLLAELLAPAPKLPPLETTSPRPKRLSPPRRIVTPDPGLPPAQLVPSRSRVEGQARPVLPRPLPEGLPFAHYQRDPLPPQRIEFPAGERVRVASADVNEPVALPKLTIRPMDATPADDPTAAASTAAALSAAPPPRVTPAPFLRLTLPDPFEHRDVLRLPRPNTDHEPPAPVPVQLPEYKR